MATVNFGVPDEIKEAFQETFANENRSAIIARLMKEAVEDRKRQERQEDLAEDAGTLPVSRVWQVARLSRAAPDRVLLHEV